jgi:glycosyltransferase involved in cell wall biosynthesis
MTKILLIANSIDKPGGAGRLEAYLAKALSALSYECVSITPSKLHLTNKQIIKDCKNIKLYILEPRARYHRIDASNYLRSLTMVDYLVTEHKMVRLLYHEKPNIVIASGGISKYLVDVARSMGAKVLVYYHMIAPWYVEVRGFYRKYKWSDLSMLYFGLSIASGKKLLANFSPLDYVDDVIVNSRYMAYIAKRYWNIVPHILQPPIEVKNFFSLPREDRLLQIVSVGRLNPDKRYEDIIEAVGRSSTLKKSMKVIFLGFAGNLRYLLHILRLARRYGVKVIMETNVSEERKREVLSSSMVFVNSSKHEHFGINVIEAMTSGIPVIVHRSGGPYFDIIDRGTYGLSYSTVEELQSNIEMLVEDPNIWNKYSQLSVARAKHYCFELFKQKIANILDKVIRND